jgi:hypothetical protein
MSVLPILASIRQPEASGLPTRQVFEQRDVNCCFSCALASAVEASDPAQPALAPLFHFYFAGGQNSVEMGITISQAMGALLTNGICAFDLYPLQITRANLGQPPDTAAVSDGIARRPIDRSTGDVMWKPLSTALPATIWKRHLAAGYPIVIGLQPNNDYLALNAAQPILASSGGPYAANGHVAAVIGYRDAESAFIVQDSRGTSFGLQGQWFLPYDFCTSPFLVIAYALAPDDFN